MVCTWKAYGMETQMSECEDIFAPEVLHKTYPQGTCSSKGIVHMVLVVTDVYAPMPVTW